MIKKLFITSLLSFFLTTNVFSAGSTDSSSGKTKTNFDKAVSLISSAKNLKKREKKKKLLKIMTKHKNY